MPPGGGLAAMPPPMPTHVAIHATGAGLRAANGVYTRAASDVYGRAAYANKHGCLVAFFPEDSIEARSSPTVQGWSMLCGTSHKYVTQGCRKPDPLLCSQWRVRRQHGLSPSPDFRWYATLEEAEKAQAAVDARGQSEDAVDLAIERHVARSSVAALDLMTNKKNATRAFYSQAGKECVPHARSCLCSRGCPTSWLGCRASSFCEPPPARNATTGGRPGHATSAPPPSPAVAEERHHPAASSRERTAILLYLAFNASHVRHRFLAKCTSHFHVKKGSKKVCDNSAPQRAYARELARLAHFLRSARRVNNTLPIHVVVAGERNATGEAALRELGAHILPGAFVEPPQWASTFHKFSFNRVGALAFTQFDKVIVMDSDMAMLGGLEELLRAPTPSMVWHPASPFMQRLGERCSVTGGLFVLRPSASEHARALKHLHGMYMGSAKFRYDGSDQEFWRSFYKRPYELPPRFHATSWLKMPASEWAHVRVIHAIHGFRPWDRRTPSFVRMHMIHFK